MKFTLIICTYQRPKAIISLLNSIQKQSLYPDEIVVIDGSLNDASKTEISKNNYQHLNYFKIDEGDRGLTKQRNYGISKVSKDIDIVCFLDDDTILNPNYFEALLNTYKKYPKAGGVGGYILDEINWRKQQPNEIIRYKEYVIDGYVRNLGSRNVLRKRLGLLSDAPPCIMPEFSNGFSVASLPPNNKIYKAEYFMGGVSSFKKEVVDTIKFSTYFEGYGLYEDLEYCLRVSKKHQLYVNTGATLYHHHEAGGRPNKYTYGKMVVRNGWYVWRVKYLNPTLKARFKWNMTVILLTKLRFLNIFTTNQRKEAFTESIGRLVGWFSLFLNKPKNKT
ncbi:MAG: glycosyl transferase family 2 [Flavobacteriaceae bacterium]|nr:MAG: glycosyl transferase family 2 [Flavobacteriaceae bacterium]